MMWNIKHKRYSNIISDVYRRMFHFIIEPKKEDVDDDDKMDVDDDYDEMEVEDEGDSYGHPYFSAGYDSY